MSVALVVLAAGASARLGACKALVDLDAAPPLARLLAAGAALAPARVLVVAGAHAGAVAAWLAAEPGLTPGIELVPHPGWAAGRTGSVAAAARAAPGHDLCVAPVDVPLVAAATFAALAAAWSAEGAPAEGWLAPRLGDRYGHPVLVGRALAARAEALAPDAPLRLLRDAARPRWAIAVDDVAILDDLDTAADLARLRARLGDRLGDRTGAPPPGPRGPAE